MISKENEIKELRESLWESADQLRANSGLKSSQYATPILGLIFLKFADVKYSQYEVDIQKEYEANIGKRTSQPIDEIAVRLCGFYLPEHSRYDYLLNLSEEVDLAEKIKEALEGIEKGTPELVGVLPKDEYFALNSDQNRGVLKKLLKIFSTIPTEIEIDIFGAIYEYFLGKFALAEGQGGGEFFTPSSVVKYMVEVLSPKEGSILDPACGSGGMFVQTAHYIQRHKKNGNEINLRAFGVEKTAETVKLAKMNLVLNNIRGTITEANSYYEDPYNSVGKFDYVMANPPFNVDGVEVDSVINQDRFNAFGIPRNKTKAKKDTIEVVPNANYLWISQFATALKKGGKAALVMPNSASDARHSEKDIREKIVKAGLISQMVSLPPKMFNTVTLPATLWFFENNSSKENEILFIDARDIYTAIDKRQREFSDEQIKNLTLITKLYQNDNEYYDELVAEYKENIEKYPAKKDYWQLNLDWVTNNFPDGVYRDVVGLCKAAPITGADSIEFQDFSLNPGRYVGVNAEKNSLSDDEFSLQISENYAEFVKLMNESVDLEKKLVSSFEVMFDNLKGDLNGDGEQ